VNSLGLAKPPSRRTRSAAGGKASRSFTPWLAIASPPAPARAAIPTGASWDPLGPPDELIEVLAKMQVPDPERNLKWLVIAEHRSQLERNPGYLAAFVKRHEFFWKARLTGT
jgi:hypothetical protein